jgi:hypothetical protein
MIAFLNISGQILEKTVIILQKLGATIGRKYVEKGMVRPNI